MSKSRADDEGFTGWARGDLAALAQVHATLALVAATVTTRAFGPQELWGGHSIEVSGEWQEATA